MTIRQRSVCPHDCPSVCALDVEIIDSQTVGRLYGTKSHSYTKGVICAKVARYAERIHHPDRLYTPLRRVGDKGVGCSAFEAIGWSDALDLIAEKFKRITESVSAEAIWPFHFAGTMGLVQRDGLDRFRHTLGTSRQHSTYCTTLSDAGWVAGTGAKRGADTRLMRHSDLIVVWGGNPVNTQVNVMHHIAQARHASQAKLVVIDPYRTRTAAKADYHLQLRPGTDGALACAVMHVLFAEGLADRAYLALHTDKPAEFETHLKTRTAEWAAAITGLSVDEIVGFARLYGSTKKSFIRLGYGFSRSRNGAVNMHAASCLPAVTGAWQVEGGGALYGNSAIYNLDRTLIQGLDVPHQHTRLFDQSRIGEVLCSNPDDLQGGPPVAALFVQNTNPAVVAPDTNRVLAGLQRTDLFTVVHEQFMTETAAYADIILPATMFLEHDDIYTASGHTHLQIGKRLIDVPAECRSNHQVLAELAIRLGLQHPGFDMDASALIDATLAHSGLPSADTVWQQGGIDLALEFEQANFLTGFATPNKRFHFAPDWSTVGPNFSAMPAMPDHWEVIDRPTTSCPLRLVAAPARQFLNTSFSETPTARRMEKQPTALLHPQDLQVYAIKSGDLVTLGNALGEVSLLAKAFDGLQVGTVIVEGLWPNDAFAGGIGINALISSEPGKPNGGAVYHDTAIWARAASTTTSPDHKRADN